MAIEKNTIPTNLGAIMEETPLVPEGDYMETVYDNGDIEFDFDEEISKSPTTDNVVNYYDDHFVNLAEEMDEADLIEIGNFVLDNFDEDKASRSQWLETANSGLSLLGIRLEETDDPFPGACGAHHPLILEAAVKFQAKASNELFNVKGPVKTLIVGKKSEEKEKQAQRVRNHMNYQVTELMEEYFDETEMLLFYLPVVGSAFKKVYYDSILKRPCSIFVPVDKFVVNYHASSLKTCSSFTHIIARSYDEYRKDVRNGLYRDLDLMDSTEASQTETTIVIDELLGYTKSANCEGYSLLEQYCYLDLGSDDPESDEEGITLPYVVTVEETTGKILSIRRNWSKYDNSKQPMIPFVHYKFVPGLGFYGFGFIHLLGNLQITLTSVMRSLVDSGSFANLQGGFVDKKLRIRDNSGVIAPGVYKEVEAGGMALKDAIVNLPFKEPSQVLLQMYQFIESRGQKFADSTEQVISDSTNYGPVGTTMALLEASTKFFSGVHKRLHKAQKNEFKQLAAINFEYLEEVEQFDYIGDTFEISKKDYDGRVDVIPVSDPNVGSQAQKLTLAQAIYTAALQKPDIHDVYEVSKYYYGTIGVDEELIEKFLPTPEQPQQLDPLSDIKMAQKGKPIAAFPGQNHDAHIAVKTAFLQDPASGANPAFQMIVPLIQSNIQEHMLLKFETQASAMAAQSGQQQQGQEEMVLAQAAQQISQMNQKMAQMQAQGPDTARNKLADAELQRVQNETAKLQIDQANKETDRLYDAIKLQLTKYAEDNKVAIAEMQTQMKAKDTELKQMTDLLKQAITLKASSESQEKNLSVQQQNQQVDKIPKE